MYILVVLIAFIMCNHHWFQDCFIAPNRKSAHTKLPITFPK